MSDMGKELRERGQPIADQLEALPLADAMTMLAYITSVQLSRLELENVPIQELIAVHAKCIRPQATLLRAMRQAGDYPCKSPKREGRGDNRLN